MLQPFCIWNFIMANVNAMASSKCNKTTNMTINIVQWATLTTKSCHPANIVVGSGTSHWRHNDHNSVSNHQPHGCLLNRLFRRRSKKTSKLRVTGRWIPRTKGQLRGKCFHLMTSSWPKAFIMISRGSSFSMMTSPNGNIFRVTGHLHGWINGLVNNGEAGDLRGHSTYHDVTLIKCNKTTNMTVNIVQYATLTTMSCDPATLSSMVEPVAFIMASRGSYSISQEICTRFLICCVLLWLYIDWFSHIHQAYFTDTAAI